MNLGSLSERFLMHTLIKINDVIEKISKVIKKKFNEKKSLINQTIGNVNNEATVPGKIFELPIPKLEEKR